MGKSWICFGMACLIAAATVVPVKAAAETAEDRQTAAVGETVSNTQSVGAYGMLPVYGCDIRDGIYSIEVESSSTMFQVVEAELRVEDGEMEADLTLSGTGYLKLFMGTGEEAAAADEDAWIGYKEDAEGRYVYTVPVEALDKKLNCAGYSKRKAQWYDRVILLEASSLPEDALLVELPDYELIEKAVMAYQQNEESKESFQPDRAENALAESASDTQSETASETEAYTEENVEQLPAAYQSFEPVSAEQKDGEYAIEVELAGGSGKSSVNSPALLTVAEGKAYVCLQWSSTYYDYMIVGGEKYLNEAEEGGYSKFTIPVSAFDEEMPVIADTTAMGEPKEIEYSLFFYGDTIGPKSRMPQEAAKRVVAIAMVIIIGGGILNHFLNKKKRV